MTLTTNMKILVKNQTTASENGLYIVNGSGAPTRLADIEHAAVLVHVKQGTANADTLWQNTDETVVLGTTDMVFTRIRTNRPPIALTGSTTITKALHDGEILLMTGTGAAYTQTLPAATGSGARFRFVVGAVNTSNHLIKVTGDDVMYGNIHTNSTGDTPDLAQPWPTAVDSDTITLNGTTTGGQAIGDVIDLIDIATDKWMVLGFTTTSGAEATPFSATVS